MEGTFWQPPLRLPITAQKVEAGDSGDDLELSDTDSNGPPPCCQVERLVPPPPAVTRDTHLQFLPMFWKSKSSPPNSAFALALVVIEPITDSECSYARSLRFLDLYTIDTVYGTWGIKFDQRVQG